MNLEVLEMVFFCVLMFIIMLACFFYFIKEAPTGSDEAMIELAEESTSDSSLQGRFLTEFAFNEEIKPLCITQV